MTKSQSCRCACPFIVPLPLQSSRPQLSNEKHKQRLRCHYVHTIHCLGPYVQSGGTWAQVVWPICFCSNVLGADKKMVTCETFRQNQKKKTELLVISIQPLVNLEVNWSWIRMLGFVLYGDILRLSFMSSAVSGFGFEKQQWAVAFLEEEDQRLPGDT